MLVCHFCNAVISPKPFLVDRGGGEPAQIALRAKLGDAGDVLICCPQCKPRVDSLRLSPKASAAPESASASPPPQRPRPEPLEEAVRQLTEKVDRLQKCIEKEAKPRPAGYAAAAKASLPKAVSRAASSAIKKVERAAAETDNRLRTVFMDGFPEAADANSDRQNVAALLLELGVPSAPVNVRRVGPVQVAGPGQSRKPRMVRIQLCSPGHQRHLTSPAIRRCLRTPFWEGRFPGLFINPSKTKEERRRLLLLRRRRDALNAESDAAKVAGSGLPYKRWMLDCRQAALVCRVDGVVDRTVRDRPIAECAGQYGGLAGSRPAGRASGPVDGGQGAGAAIGSAATGDGLHGTCSRTPAAKR